MSWFGAEMEEMEHVSEDEMENGALDALDKLVDADDHADNVPRANALGVAATRIEITKRRGE